MTKGRIITLLWILLTCALLAGLIGFACLAESNAVIDVRIITPKTER